MQFLNVFNGDVMWNVEKKNVRKRVTKSQNTALQREIMINLSNSDAEE